uniref:Dynamin N-terminal domain-containing protein n=1 Tax=Sinocyclocheilus grahami TaxID=75366 RepID=A0A672NJD1_SINGR
MDSDWLSVHLEENMRPYIDLIDTLRSVGIHKDLALPTIVVIGDQSSGKSSVLEALSGVAFPRGSDSLILTHFLFGLNRNLTS